MNLTDYIRQDLDFILSSFKGWRKIDNCDVITDDQGNYLSIYPELLNYIIKDDEVYEVWIACKFQDKDLELCSHLVEYFNKNGLCPMTSDNFIKKYFVVDSEHCICYFNPKYVKSLKVKDFL